MNTDSSEGKNILYERQKFIKLLKSINIESKCRSVKLNPSKRSMNLNAESVEKDDKEKKNISTGNEMQETYQTTFSVMKHPGISEKEIKDFLKIHVYDRIKGTRKIFKWPRELSLNKIRYFRDKISSSPDIYVECDTKAFSWILRWLTKEKELTLNSDLLPRLLEASYTLDSPSLRTACMQFWRVNVRFVMREGQWQSLDEKFIDELANLFDNSALEELSCNSALQEVLYTKFIIFLNEPTPKRDFGHFKSLCRMFKCKFCKKCVTEATRSLPCQAVELDSRGKPSWAHCRPRDWSLCDFIKQLKEKHKQWRLVYWFLWSSCHVLNCSTCLKPFPLLYINRCRSHSKEPGNWNKKQNLCFPCCGQVDSVFETVPTEKGCIFRRHTPILNSIDDQNIYKIFNAIYHNIPFESLNPKRDKIQMKAAFDGKALVKKISFIDEKYFKLHKDNVTEHVKGAKQKKILKGCWQVNSSIGFNQDSQRDLQERNMKIIQNFLSKSKIKEENICEAKGGSYVNIKNRWWNEIRNEDKNPSSQASKLE